MLSLLLQGQLYPSMTEPLWSCCWRHSQRREANQRYLDDTRSTSLSIQENKFNEPKLKMSTSKLPSQKSNIHYINQNHSINLKEKQFFLIELEWRLGSVDFIKQDRSLHMANHIPVWLRLSSHIKAQGPLWYDTFRCSCRNGNPRKSRQSGKSQRRKSH
jgi:hypothetical protein